MTWVNGDRIRLVFVGISVAFVLSNGSARADFVFGKPQDLGLGTGGSISGHISISADELEIFFTSDRAGGLGNEDIWMSKRQSIEESWETPTNLQTVNSSYREAYPSISPDGLLLYFSDYFYGPDRPGGLGGHDLWMSTRDSSIAPWNTPINMGAPFNSSNQEVSPTISHDGLTFIFASDRPGGSGGYDLWMCTRPSLQDNWGPPVNLGSTVNSGSHDYYGNLSPDGLVLFFESNRSGTYEGWKTMRRSVDDPWQTPARLPEPLYSMGVGCVSADGSAYYPGTSKVPIIPIVDFNGDGIVDSADMCIMIDHWHTDYPRCDIGPAPWGDGIVDVEDLKVLAEHLFEEVSDPTLVAHWPLDETEGTFAADSVGDNDAFVVGGASWQPGSGQIDGALQLDGVSGCAIAGPVLNPADGPFSVLAWVKDGAPGQVVVSQQAIANWLAMDAAGNLMTELKCTGRSAGPLYSETVITDGQWHRIGLVWDGSHRTLYVDGVAVADDIQPGLEGSQMGLYIGVDKNYAPGTFFSGLIDDIRIYNRAVSHRKWRN